MSATLQLWTFTKNQILGWSWLKRLLMLIAVITFLTSSFLFLTPPGTKIRMFLADTVITTQHRDWAWIFVGADKRDYMVRQVQAFYDKAAEEKQDLSLINHVQQQRKDRSLDELVKVEDISGKYWVGKKIYVYDPKSIRVVVPNKPGEGERISSMVKRTGAVAGVNGGGFIDPDGLGNGFAPIGLIMSADNVIYTDTEGHEPQMVVGFTDEGTLVIGKYSIVELRQMHVSEAVSFYPRVIANGKPLIASGDGGWGRGPRTAVGQKADGTVIFMVIDGRQTHSIGANLKEIQDLMLEEGCINAGFLDGGASSELVYNGDLITKPSSRYGERRLPSAFLVFDHPEDYKADHPWDGLTKIDPGGAYDHPDYLREQAALKAKQEAERKANPPKPADTAPAKKPDSVTTKPSSTGTGNSTGGTSGNAKTGTSPNKTVTPSNGTGTTPATGGTTNTTTGTTTTPPANGTPPATNSGAVPGSTGSPAGGTTTGATTSPTGSGNVGTAPGSATTGTGGTSKAPESTSGSPSGTTVPGSTTGTTSNTAPVGAAGSTTGTAPATPSGSTGTAPTGVNGGSTTGGSTSSAPPAASQTPPAAPNPSSSPASTAAPSSTTAGTPTTPPSSGGAATSQQSGASSSGSTTTAPAATTTVKP